MRIVTVWALATAAALIAACNPQNQPAREEGAPSLGDPTERDATERGRESDVRERRRDPGGRAGMACPIRADRWS
jgi:hypothetical protein